jgi:glyoxylase-like metal-dependent hydrolase (beta-lactamase superfamily II)
MRKSSIFMRLCMAQIQRMNSKQFASAFVTFIAATALLVGCAATAHDTTPSALGVQRPAATLEAVVDQPGPVEVETVVAARWEVDRGGLINLENPAAKAAGLKDGPEPIELFVHVVRHPTRGVYLIDSGAEHAFLADPDHALIHGMLGGMAHLDKLKIRHDTQGILAHAGAPVQGVLLTHLHLDHVLGLRDVPANVPVYVGAGDAEDSSFLNLFERSVYDTALAGKGALREITFDADPSGAFEGVRDIFGDGSFWAISVPGHTPGSIAYLARTPRGPVLLTGDACHTAWGWQHSVEPGSFSDDRARSADSLARLERFAAHHPSLEVRLGHQELPARAQ